MIGGTRSRARGGRRRARRDRGARRADGPAHDAAPRARSRAGARSRSAWPRAPGVEVRYGAELRSAAPGRRAASSSTAGRRIDAVARRARCSRCRSTRCPAVGFDAARSPPRPPRRSARNAGRAHKVWLRARGVPAGVLAAGAGEGLHWLYADRVLDGGDVLLLGFGYEDRGLRPRLDAPTWSARCARSSPRPTLVALDHHDWNADPFSRGTWATAPVGRRRGLLTPERFPPHGRDRVRDVRRGAARGGLDRGRAASRARRPRAGRWSTGPADCVYATRWRASFSSSISMPRPGPEGTRTKPSANSKPDASTSSASCDSATVYSQ